MDVVSAKASGPTESSGAQTAPHGWVSLEARIVSLSYVHVSHRLLAVSGEEGVPNLQACLLSFRECSEAGAAVGY